MAIFNRNSKADTLALYVNSGGGASDLVTDHSQHAALGGSLTDGGTYLWSNLNPWVAQRSPRELSLVVNLDNNDAGILINYGSTDGTQFIYKITVNGAGSVAFVQNGGTTLATIALPGVTGTASPYILHWSTDYDEVADSYYSEFAVCRIASGAWTIQRVAHAEPVAAGGGWQLNVSGYGAGLSTFSGGLSAYTSVRISARFHSTVEAKEDWESQSSDPTIIGFQPATELAPTSAVFFEADPSDPIADAILDNETFGGPAEWLAALHAGTGRQRLYSSLLNLKVNDPPTLTPTWLPANFYASGTGGYQYGVNHLYCCPLPMPPSNGGLYGRVRVHVQSWLAGGAPGGSSARIQVRMRSSTNPDGSGSSSESNAATTTTNHTSSGIGQWLDLGELTLRRNSQDMTYLALGLTFNTSVGVGGSYRRAKIKALAVDIYSKDG